MAFEWALLFVKALLHRRSILVSWYIRIPCVVVDTPRHFRLIRRTLLFLHSLLSNKKSQFPPFNFFNISNNISVRNNFLSSPFSYLHSTKHIKSHKVWDIANISINFFHQTLFHCTLELPLKYEILYKTWQTSKNCYWNFFKLSKRYFLKQILLQFLPFLAFEMRSRFIHSSKFSCGFFNSVGFIGKLQLVEINFSL